MRTADRSLLLSVSGTTGVSTRHAARGVRRGYAARGVRAPPAHEPGVGWRIVGVWSAIIRRAPAANTRKRSQPRAARRSPRWFRCTGLLSAVSTFPKVSAFPTGFRPARCMAPPQAEQRVPAGGVAQQLMPSASAVGGRRMRSCSPRQRLTGMTQRSQNSAVASTCPHARWCLISSSSALS
jgi:hypothetical protein